MALDMYGREIKKVVGMKHKCMYCGTEWGSSELNHPPGEVEFINGYPAPCRKNGVSLFIQYGEKDIGGFWLSAIPVFE